MSTRNDYWAYLQPRNADLMHYGVKGMKWGQRHDYVPTGRYRFINRRQGTDRYSRSTARRSSRSSQYATPQQRKIMNRIKIARGATIVAGTAMAVYGGYKWGKVLRSPAGKTMLANGKRQLMNRTNQGLTYARNLNRARRQVTNAGLNVARANPVIRTTSRVVGAPKKLISGTRAGRIALKAYGTATAVSDVNTTYHWVKDMKKKGNVTKKDVGNLAKDLIVPVPNNLPGINKRARAARKAKKNNKSK